MEVTRGDIQDAAGSIQLCAGQPAGTEAVIHAMRESFHNVDTEAGRCYKCLQSPK